MEVGHWIALAALLVGQAGLVLRWTAGMSERLIRLEEQGKSLKESLDRIERGNNTRGEEIHEIRDELRAVSDEVRDIDRRVRTLGGQTPGPMPARG